MTTVNQNFTMYAGDTKNLLYEIAGENDAPFDITGCSFLWVAKKNVRGKNVVAKSTSYGIEITDALSGKLKINLLPSDTSKMSNDYYHELEMTDSRGNVSTISTGTMTVLLSGANASLLEELPIPLPGEEIVIDGGTF